VDLALGTDCDKEKTWKEQIWEEKGWKDQWDEYSKIVVSDKEVVEIASEKAAERVTRKRMSEKAVGEAAEKLWIRQIQVSSGFLLVFFLLTWVFSINRIWQGQ